MVKIEYFTVGSCILLLLIYYYYLLLISDTFLYFSFIFPSYSDIIADFLFLFCSFIIILFAYLFLCVGYTIEAEFNNAQLLKFGKVTYFSF